jgi:hypothetical protein
MNRTALTKLPAFVTVLVAVSVVAASAEAVDFSGYLYDEGTEARFDVYAETQLLDVTFTYPATADFHVKVLGQTGKELGDFALAEGPVIQLKVGGKFTFVVYTESGGGAWTAFYER